MFHFQSLAPMPMDSLPLGRPERDRPRRREILVADDMDLIREMLASFFRQRGIKCWLTSNGLEAVDAYRDHGEDIGLVLLDVRMPRLDGPNAFARLKEFNPAVACYFMSGDTAPYTEEQLLELGAVGLLPKPSLLPALAGIVRDFV
jgi:CheY-like chemotaxis protein